MSGYRGTRLQQSNVLDRFEDDLKLYDASSSSYSEKIGENQLHPEKEYHIGRKVDELHDEKRRQEELQRKNSYQRQRSPSPRPSDVQSQLTDISHKAKQVKQALDEMSERVSPSKDYGTSGGFSSAPDPMIIQLMEQDKKKMSALNQEVDSMREQMEDVAQRYDQLQQMMKKLKRESSDKDRMIEELNDELEELRQDNAKLQQQAGNSELRKEQISQLQQNVKAAVEAKQQLAVVFEEKENLLKEKKQLNEENETLKKKITDKDKLIRELKTKILELDAENDTIQADNDALTEDLQQVHKEIESKDEQIANLRDKLESAIKSSASASQAAKGAQKAEMNVDPLLLAYEPILKKLPRRNGETLLEEALMVVRKWMGEGEGVIELTEKERKKKMKKLMEIIEGKKEEPSYSKADELKYEQERFLKEKEELNDALSEKESALKEKEEECIQLKQQHEQSVENYNKLSNEIEAMSKRLSSHPFYLSDPDCDDHSVVDGQNMLIICMDTAEMNEEFFEKMRKRMKRGGRAGEEGLENEKEGTGANDSTTSAISPSSASSSSASSFNSTGIKTFLSVDFFMFDSQKTPIVEGMNPEYKFVAKYTCDCTPYFFHYLDAHFVRFELYTVDLKAKCIAEGRLNFSDLIQHYSTYAYDMKMMSVDDPDELVSTVSISVETLLPFRFCIPPEITDFSLTNLPLLSCPACDNESNIPLSPSQNEQQLDNNQTGDQSENNAEDEDEDTSGSAQSDEEDADDI
ncbi:putative First C2 domain of RPGR-interacting protein 1 [Monocercomonoides exilis]|uniref:putative First C2 domain of RPGR-interacting protein 1 n=1 Tax=Monocercomonoides exilis TaxID=2049356 RepID=UPI00355AB218|nr:putative First C2 domain of RPGR-interacting protein 1 [Monocercomonoides exilis]|eukprot:MONOS_9737.1-p1 / transcript=MONOS_9737.1 / gene=MONOS_9737 / organism=Monocercomonoides_exilis_PA203 / gene_product=unspecified product / transcript_product=unspecified product / location=Mono_scaffold00414:1234-5440(+) / protein_length=748 / sequence_SO=supercontig / SO=protein_coding / is_pseudo=false